ncbi:MAG: hypothetical protein WAW63_00215 [Candidatus Saccharimonadales bacterium]|jgi:hypothetical protein|nr:hypothetical protein [Candidatus Saccharibacteria bacterium]
MAGNTGWNLFWGAAGLVGTAYLGVQALDTYEHAQELRGRVVRDAGSTVLYAIGDQPHIGRLVLGMEEPGGTDPAAVDANLAIAEIQLIGAIGSMMLGAGNIIALKK